MQVTGRRNYALFSQKLGIDLVSNPDLALTPKVAADIMYMGMTQGLFTGRKLADYFNSKTTDWVNARRIINGLDRAALIASYAQQFYAALKAANNE